MGLVLVFFAVQVGLATFAEERHEATHHEGEADAGSDCPDSDDGQPCGATCPCMCCPGHFVGVPSEAGPVLAALVPAPVERVTHANELPRSGVAGRIFRPPRA